VAEHLQLGNKVYGNILIKVEHPPHAQFRRFHASMYFLLRR
jgi:hypothetical protein